MLRRRPSAPTPSIWPAGPSSVVQQLHTRRRINPPRRNKPRQILPPLARWSAPVMATAGTIQSVKRQPPFSGDRGAPVPPSTVLPLQNKHLEASCYGRSRQAPSSSPPTPSSATSRLVKVQVSSCSFVSGCSFSRLGPSRTIPTPPAVPTTSRRPSCSPPCNLAIAPASASSRIQRETQDGEACFPAHHRRYLDIFFGSLLGNKLVQAYY